MGVDSFGKLNYAGLAHPDVLTVPYALFINIPVFKNESGKYFLGELWIKDLVGHLSYISDLTLVCPVVNKEPPCGFFPIASCPGLDQLKIETFPAVGGIWSALAILPRMLIGFMRICSRSDVIHIGVTGWPIPYGWIVAGLCRLFYRHKFLLAVVESAPWRISIVNKVNLKQEIKAKIFEGMAKWCVNHADLSVFTQEQYKNSLLSVKHQTGHTIHASWIDEAVIPSYMTAERLWGEKLSLENKQLKLIFVGRLISEKGVVSLLDALKMLPIGTMVSLDILGAGELIELCEVMASAMDAESLIQVRVMGTMPYGNEYFAMLRKYHALVVPTISDEQPRVIYDAFSQAIPVIVSDTYGNRDCVTDGVNGLFFTPGDPSDLAKIILSVYRDKERLRKLGISALLAAKKMTHQEMHKKRSLLLMSHPKMIMNQETRC